MSRVSRRTALMALLCVPAVAPSPAFAAVGSTSASALASVAPRRAATIRGRVMDRETGQPVVAAQVRIVGSGAGTLTGNDGRYVLTNVSSGTIQIRVFRLGYEQSTQSVTVPESGEVTADFQLGRVVTRLEEVVTTATGEQSRREMGNVVATVKAESLAAVAPITNVNEMLQARTSGVQVVQGQGVIGASSSIRIRGTSSMSLSNEPLVVVDGVRYDNQAEPGSFAGVRINRLSTLNPEEIESIDIIKGPSASALYGTAAANGVVIISTKRGRLGAPRWSVFAEGGYTTMPYTYPTNYLSWGRNITGGVPGGSAVQCKLAAKALGQCVIDSLTSYNPWTDSLTNPWSNGPTQSYGVQVAGGAENLKYFASVTRQDETGPYKMPSFEVNRITALRGRPLDQAIRPNTLRNTAARASFTFPVGKNANFDLSTGYTDRDLWTPFDGTFFAGLSNQLLSAPGYKTPSNGTAREFVGDIFEVQQRTTLERVLGSVRGTWTPTTWLNLVAEGGIDNANAYNYQLQLPGQGTRVGAAWGPSAIHGFSGKDVNRTNTIQYTTTVRGAATRNILDNLLSTTTLGTQWFRSGTYRTFGEGYGLALGSSTPNAAQQRIASEFTTEDATYGVFLSQQLAYNDRIFLTASARTDRHSAFGSGAGTTVYPSGSLSYVISEESWFPKISFMDRLRLRSSMGKAGLPPSPGTAALQFLTAATYPSGSTESPGFLLASVGNSKLKPEVTTEVEGGFDLAMFREKVNVEFTVFNKTSQGQLFNRPLAPSWGSGTNQWINVAKVRNAGQELTIDVQAYRSNLASLSLRVNGSHLKNKLVDIGDDVQLAKPQGTRQVVGYPLNGLWDRPFTYNDANGDGIIVPSEITLASADAFKGSTLPEWEAGFSPSLGLFKDRLSINALFDYRGNFWNSYTIGSNRCVSAGNCEAVNVPGSDLAEQAAAVAASTATLANSRWGIFQPNDFIRFRELSVSANLPDNIAQRYMRARSARLVFAGRNLGVLWTKYPGIDPEANRLVANNGGGNDDLGTPPAIRTYSVRLNVAF